MIDIAEIEEAEVGILSCMIQDSTTIEQICEQIEPTDFLQPEHQVAMRVLADFHRAGGNTQDVKTVVGLFRKAGILEQLGGVGGMKDWTGVFLHNLPFFLATIRDAVRVRKLSRLSADLSDMLYRNEKPSRMVDYLEQGIRRLSLSGDIKFDSLEQGIQQIIDLAHAPAKDTVESGIADIDSIIGPMTGGELIVVAARPSVGKSALAVHMALKVAQAGNPVLMVSLEMRTVDLVSRILTQQTSVTMSELKAMQIDEDSMEEIQQAKENAKSIPFYMLHARRVTVDRIKAAASLRKACGGLKLLVIDYIGLVSPRDPRKPRFEHISEVSAALKDIAIELDIPVLVLCQLNRTAEKEEPNLSHLRDSGAIEQDADLVILLHREDRNSTEVKFKIAKNRQGAIGETVLKFDPKTTSFVQKSAKDMPNYVNEFEEYDGLPF